MSHTVLVIDDEPSIRHALDRALRWCGYQVLLASGADSAYELLSEAPVDLVLLDVRMPQMSGDTLFFALVRRWPQLRQRIIFMSGDPEHCRDEWPEELRRRPLLPKPFTLRDLEALLERILAEGQGEEPLRSNGSA